MDFAAELQKLTDTVTNSVIDFGAELARLRDGGMQQPAAPLVQPAVEAPKKPDYIDRLGVAESSGKATAKAKTSSALGPHQFLDKTWGDLSTKYKLGYSLDDRVNPEKSRKVAELYTNENRIALKKVLKEEPTDTQLYTAHFLGATGATKLLTAPPMAAAIKHVDAKQVKANKDIFYDKKTGKPRKVIEVYSLLQKKIGEV